MNRVCDLLPLLDMFVVPDAGCVFPLCPKRSQAHDGGTRQMAIVDPSFKTDLPLLFDNRSFRDDQPTASLRALLVVLQHDMVRDVRRHGAVARQCRHGDAVGDVHSAELQGLEERRKLRGGHLEST